MGKQLTVGELKKFIGKYDDSITIGLFDRKGSSDILCDIMVILDIPEKIMLSILPVSEIKGDLVYYTDQEEVEQ